MKPRKMKDSGIPWIGQIPEGWDVRRLKRAGSIIVDKCMPDDCGAGDGLMYLGLEHVESQTGHLVSDYEPIRDFAGDAIRFDKGNVLFGKLRPYLAKCWLADTEGKCSSEYFVLKPDDQCIGKYLNWTMLSNRFIDLVDGSTFGVKMPRAEWSFVGNIHMPFPSSEEQERIAAYLDGKCGEIDRVISAKEQQNELLHDQRIAIIHEAITKGLKPDVTYTDSKVPWIGDIPCDWKLIRLRFLCDISTGDKDTVDREEEGAYPFYVRSPNVERIGTYSFDGEAVLMAGDGVGAGKVFHYANGKFDYHQRVYNLHNFRQVVGRYLFYYLQANFCKEIECCNAKSTVDSVRMPMLQNFPVAFGSPAEQKKIISYIEERCGEIDRVMEANEKMVAKLKAYRSSVIWEAVTGKVAV